MFYEFQQNNSGGYFVENDKVCHRLFIEADSEREAIWKAEELGCYWDGVSKGIDCPCCGNRWNCNYIDTFDSPKEIAVSIYCESYIPYIDTKEEWYEKYGSYEIAAPPIFEKGIFEKYTGKIRFNTIEEYAQYLANEHGWTTPDARIFYKDGTVKEIFSIMKG